MLPDFALAVGKYWFGLAGSAVIVGQCTRSGKYWRQQQCQVCIGNGVIVKGFHIHDISFYHYSSTVSAVHCETQQEFARFSNSAETLTKAHCLPLDTSLKQQSAWWILPLTVKSASDIIWTYFHSQFRRKYSLLSVNTLLRCRILCHVACTVKDWLPPTNILAYSQNHP